MELLNAYNTAENGTSTCICTDIIKNVFGLIRTILGLENERAQWKMFNDIESQHLWYKNIILEADFYLRPGSSIYAGLPETAVIYKCRGIPLSTVLVNLLRILYFKLRSPCCCSLVWDKTMRFSTKDFQTIGALGSLRGKIDFMYLLVKYGYISSLSDTSPLLKQETDEIMLSFIEAVRNSADMHLPNTFATFEDVMNLLKNIFFRGKETEAIYKRVFFVACALRAVEYSLQNKHAYADKFIKCLRLYFSVTCDLYLSTYEVRCVLYSCFILLHKLVLFEQYAQEFDKLMPECPARPKPPTLTQLARCQIRKNLKFSKLPLPSAVDKLALSKNLKGFIVGKELPGKSGNTSLQKAVTKSELEGLLLERSLF